MTPTPSPTPPTATERAYSHTKARVLDGTYPGGALITEGDVSDDAAPKSEHVQEAEPRSSGRLKRPPFVPLEAEGPPAERKASVTDDDLGPPPSPPMLEAGSGGPDLGLILLLLIVGGFAATAVFWLFLH